MATRQPRYWVDTNVILRYLLHDNEVQFANVRELFQKQEAGRIKAECVVQVVVEAVHVLRSFYKVPRAEIGRMVGDYVKSAPIEIENRNGLIWVLDTYGRTTLGLVDILLLEKARSEGGEIFSFDKKLLAYQKKTL